MAQLRSTVPDDRVLDAIAAVPRHLFVPRSQAAHAYDNSALPIGSGQTISQPVVVARMLTLLALVGSERVLDVGTGSGYHAALLGRLTAHVDSIERHVELTGAAREALTQAGVANVTLFTGDGAAGLSERAPYDAINIAASCADDIPQALIDQLAPGGRLVAPVGGRDQRLVLLRRNGTELERQVHEAVRFVPLVSS